MKPGIVGATSAPAQASSDLRQRDDTASLQGETEATDSFATLRSVDDHPLCEMSYVGDDDSLYNVVPVELPSSFGCSLFESAGGAVDPAAALGILEAVHQGHTQWSVVYDLATGDGRVVMGQQWANVYEFDL